MLHLHVQKQNIVHRAVIIQQLHAVGELRHRELGAVLPGVPLHIALKLRPHLCLVLDQSNAYHCRTSFFRNFSVFIVTRNRACGKWENERRPRKAGPPDSLFGFLFDAVSKQHPQIVSAPVKHTVDEHITAIHMVKDQIASADQKPLVTVCVGDGG